MSLRTLDSDERRLLEALLSASGLAFRDTELLRVQSLEDGGMGSVRLIPQSATTDRAFGRAVSEARFEDTDSVEVIATLYVDREDQPFEIDIWKTDLSPLVKIPANISACPAQ